MFKTNNHYVKLQILIKISFWLITSSISWVTSFFLAASAKCQIMTKMVAHCCRMSAEIMKVFCIKFWASFSQWVMLWLSSVLQQQTWFKATRAFWSHCWWYRHTSKAEIGFKDLQEFFQTDEFWSSLGMIWRILFTFCAHTNFPWCIHYHRFIYGNFMGLINSCVCDTMVSQ